MQQGPVILRRLFPSGQGSAKPVHPACLLPVTVTEVRGFTGISFLFTGRDIRLVTTAQPVCFQPGCFVAFVRAESWFFAPGIPPEEHRVCPPPV
ncbi:hypothetical protein AV903_21225 [Erwinia tracheiphila]|uniref:Uncharacterized protein n=1 Tax=Erwinia tracheiphila TaxID=65700 RepID=A0A345CWZ0_9GAMM|nr:hypothetical protein AV903_21225 [Erwinia tracheiphila]